MLLVHAKKAGLLLLLIYLLALGRAYNFTLQYLKSRPAKITQPDNGTLMHRS
jgi:hypothetical protein